MYSICIRTIMIGNNLATIFIAIAITGLAAPPVGENWKMTVGSVKFWAEAWSRLEPTNKSLMDPFFLHFVKKVIIVCLWEGNCKIGTFTYAKLSCFKPGSHVITEVVTVSIYTFPACKRIITVLNISLLLCFYILALSIYVNLPFTWLQAEASTNSSNIIFTLFFIFWMIYLEKRKKLLLGCFIYLHCVLFRSSS